MNIRTLSNPRRPLISHLADVVPLRFPQMCAVTRGTETTGANDALLREEPKRGLRGGYAPATKFQSVFRVR